MKQMSLLEYIKDLHKFFNRREVPAAKLVRLLGHQRPSPMAGGAVLTPYEKRIKAIIVRYLPRDLDVIKQISFAHQDNALELKDMVETFGPYTASWNEKENSTMLTCTSFPEEDVVESIVHRIEGYRMEDADGGYMLEQPGGKKVFVPIAEMLVITTTVVFKEFQRPPEVTAAKKPGLRGM